MQEVIPVKRRSPYKLASVKGVGVESIGQARAGQPCSVGIDVAKHEAVLCLYWPDKTFDRPWRVRLPGEVGLVTRKFLELKASCPLVLAMESSGTYGDVLRQAAADAGLEVRRVSGIAVKGHAEAFDGVPSQHDGKDAAVIAERTVVASSPGDDSTNPPCNSLRWRRMSPRRSCSSRTRRRSTTRRGRWTGRRL